MKLCNFCNWLFSGNAKEPKARKISMPTLARKIDDALQQQTQGFRAVLEGALFNKNGTHWEILLIVPDGLTIHHTLHAEGLYQKIYEEETGQKLDRADISHYNFDGHYIPRPGAGGPASVP